MFKRKPSPKQRTKKYVISTNIVELMAAIQNADQFSEEEIVSILALLNIKIVHEYVGYQVCLELVDVIVNYLDKTKPGRKVENLCTNSLKGVGSKNPQMVFKKLWDKEYNRCLPPRSLLFAVGELSRSRGSALLIGRIWQRIVLLLRMAQEEDDMLAICHALEGLVTCARKHLCTGHEKVMAIFENELSFRADLTFRVILNRWTLKDKDKVTEKVLEIFGNMFYLMSPATLKNQVNRLTRWLMTLMSTEVMPFYVSQCIWQLVDALALSGCGGMNLESQLENITGMLFEQLKKKVKSSDSKSVENHRLTLEAFLVLTKLYQNKLVSLLTKNMESSDSLKIILALRVFTHVFEEVPQTAKVQRQVMNATIFVIREDLRPVPKVLLDFIELLTQGNYLCLPEANFIIYYIGQLSEPDPTNEEDIQIRCSKILQMVPLSKLVTLVCYSTNVSGIVPLSKAATEKALKVLSLGKIPSLREFHFMPTEVISPQRLLIQLMLFCQKPYKVKELGASSLRLLHALDPIIHSNVDDLWNKAIPQMLKILENHSEENLRQEEWEDRLLQFLSQSLVAVDDDNWLQQLIRVILKISYFSDVGDEEKAFLYRFYGFSLRTSKNEQVIKMMLSAMLQTSHEEPKEREGIAEALSVVSRDQLEIVLEEVELYSAVLTDKDSSPILKLTKEHQQREWALVCNTIYLSYSKIILESKDAIFKHLDGILALVLQHYHNCILEKDKNLQRDYLDALTILTDNLSSQQHMACGFSFPQKLSLINLMVDLISAEPLDSISSPIRQKAMHIITNFRMLEPHLEVQREVELLQLCFRSVFCPPPRDSLQKDASSPEDTQANVDPFIATMGSLQRLTEAVITEMVIQIEDCLELLDPWLNSQKDNERERAMQCAAHVLGFATRMDNSKMQVEITQLGHWVKLLAVCCQDPVDNIRSLSSQAACNLNFSETEKQKLALQQEEDKSRRNLCPRNAIDVGKAFAQYFTQPQLTNLVLTTMEELSSSRAQVSLASAQLMSAVIQERGTEIGKVEEIVEVILEQLEFQLEPSTKEETLRAMCLLADKHTRTVVLLLLNKPLPWDRAILAPWKVFVTRRETSINILQLLTGILEQRCTEETREMVAQRVMAAYALYEMLLSGCLCRDSIRELFQASIHELFPQLLLAVLCHLHWVIDNCALEVVKLLLTAACGGVMADTEEYECWELLCNPQLYYLGVIELTSGIVKNCKPAILQQILNHVENLLCSLDNHQKIMARSIYAELLCHGSVAETPGHDFVGNLSSWITEPDHVIKEIGLRGISNLALHPGKSETLKTLVPILEELLKDNEWRVRVQALKALQNIPRQGKRKDIKLVFGTMAEQLRELINDEKDEVRISAVSALGHMLGQLKKLMPGSALRKQINSFLVLLLLRLQDNNTDVVKACGRALTEWTKVMGWPPLTNIYQDTDVSDHVQVLEETSKYLVSTRKTQTLGNLLLQSFEFLNSTQPFLRTAAVTFIASITLKINLKDIHEDDVQLLQNKMWLEMRYRDGFLGYITLHLLGLLASK